MLSSRPSHLSLELCPFHEQYMPAFMSQAIDMPHVWSVNACGRMLMYVVEYCKVSVVKEPKLGGMEDGCCVRRVPGV